MGRILFLYSSLVGSADLSAQWRVLWSVQRGGRAWFDQDFGQLRRWQERYWGTLLQNSAVGVVGCCLRARSSVLTRCPALPLELKAKNTLPSTARHSAEVRCFVNGFASSPVTIMVCNTVLQLRVKPWETQLSAAPIMHQSRQESHVQAQAAMPRNLCPAWPLDFSKLALRLSEAMQQAPLVHIVTTYGHLV